MPVVQFDCRVEALRITENFKHAGVDLNLVVKLIWMELEEGLRLIVMVLSKLEIMISQDIIWDVTTGLSSDTPLSTALFL